VVPRWYARLLVVLLALVTGFGSVGLVLAIAGSFEPLIAGPVGGAATAILLRLGWHMDETPGQGRGNAWATAALIVAVGWVAVNIPYAGEHTVVNRDPGVYLVAGRWLASHGSLVVEAGVGPFAGAEGVSFESAGTYDEGGGSLDLQFTHLIPVLLAAAYWIGGSPLIFAMPVLLGGMAILMTYALASRLTDRTWAGFVVASGAAICLPILGATRDTYSEGAAWLLLSGGLWAWTRAADEQRPALAACAGLALGAAALARVDAIVYLLPVPILAGVLAGRGGEASTRACRRTAVALAVGILPGVGLGAVDLLLRSRQYYRDLRPEMVGLWSALAAAIAIGASIAIARSDGRARSAGAWRWARGHRRRIGAAAAVAVVAVGSFAWFVRPHVQVARSSAPFEYVGAIQVAEGEPAMPDRRYDERSVEWLAWYVGAPAVALAIAGAAMLARRAVLRSLAPASIAWLALGAGTAFYLWRPSITPDHLWASRRLVPAAIPLVLTLAAAAIAGAVTAIRQRDRPRLAVVVGACLSLAVLSPTAARTWPVARLSDQHGNAELADDLCTTVEGGVVLAVAGERAGIGLPQTVRSFCDVPVALVQGTDDRALVIDLARSWAAEGRPLFVMASATDVLQDLVPNAVPRRLGPYESDQALEVTVTRPPARLAHVSETIFVVEVIVS
jgi:hypothetical protein